MLSLDKAGKFCPSSTPKAIAISPSLEAPLHRLQSRLAWQKSRTFAF